MRHSPRALAAWAAAAIVAFATANIVATDLASLHRRARDVGPARDVVVAVRDLALGATVQASDVEIVSLYGSTAPSGALTMIDDAVGRTVAIPVLEGAVVVTRHLADADRDGIDGLVPRGHRAVRVVTEDGLRPEAGAIVDVLASFDPSLVAASGANDPVLVVARAALVLAQDNDVYDEDPAEFAGRQEAGVTLLVSEREAQNLAFASANGVLMLALAPPEAACCHDNPPDTARDGG